jgi:hypothetical protein
MAVEIRPKKMHAPIRGKAAANYRVGSPFDFAQGRLSAPRILTTGFDEPLDSIFVIRISHSARVFE